MIWRKVFASGNVLLGDMSDTCKLADFGSSRRLPATSAGGGTGTGSGDGASSWLGGTLAYRAPELLRGEAPSAACDVFSFGICAWQLRARRAPYDDTLHPLAVAFCVVARHLRPDTHHAALRAAPALLELATRCWAPCPADRPTLRPLCQELRQLAD